MTVKAPEETRGRILAAAFVEFYHHGFQGGSLNRIIETAETTKGALFHHFNGKAELGYTVVEEVCGSMIREHWIEPLAGATDPVASLKAILNRTMREELKGSSDLLCNGCPLNNFAQEMSPLDEGFRNRIETIYNEWRTAIEKAFQNGLQQGTVRPGVSPKRSAAFIVAALAGIVGTGKNAQSLELIMDAGEELIHYLDTLKA